MEQILRIAKSQGIPKWRTLRIKVTNAKKNAETELGKAREETEWFVPELISEVEALDRVLVWMDQIEGALDE